MSTGVALVVVLLLLVLVSRLAMRGRAEPQPDAGSALPIERPVLQLSEGGGMVFTARPQDLIPDVTLWADGRVVFVASDGVIRDGRLDATTTADLRRAGEALYALADTYAASDATDVGGVSLVVDGSAGPKGVYVHGRIPDGTWPYARPADRPAFEVLRALRGAVRGAVTQDAPPLAPDEVAIYAIEVHHHEGPPPPEWPPELLGVLAGERAREAIRRQGGLGPHPPSVVRIGGRPHLAVAVPILPVLESRSGAHSGIDGLPLPPAATLTNAWLVTGRPTDRDIRLARATRQDLAAWYSRTMPMQGWHLATERSNASQMWVRDTASGYVSAGLLELRFRPGGVSTRFLPVGVEGGLQHPASAPSGCPGPLPPPGQWCQLVQGVPPDAAETWFRDHLGYLGWRELRPDVYVREYDRGYYRESYELRLTFRVAPAGTFVTAESVYTPPVDWPTPAVRPAAGTATAGAAQRAALAASGALRTLPSTQDRARPEAGAWAAVAVLSLAAVGMLALFKRPPSAP